MATAHFIYVHHALGNGLTITSPARTDQAESSSETSAHLQHNGETEGNLRVCALMPILYPEHCVRMYSVFPWYGARAAESLSIEPFSPFRPP